MGVPENGGAAMAIGCQLGEVWWMRFFSKVQILVGIDDSEGLCHFWKAVDSQELVSDRYEIVAVSPQADSSGAHQ